MMFSVRLRISLLMSVICFVELNAIESFHSPFTARPLRIRLVNYERQFLPPKHLATPAEVAEKLVAPHAHNMPNHQSASFVAQQNDEPIQSFSRNVYSGGSYLQEVRRRMRAGGGKIHTSATALTIPNVSAEASEQDPRRLSHTDEAKRLFDDEIEPNVTKARVAATRRFVTQTTELPKQENSPPPASSSTLTTATERVTLSITESGITTPVKVRPVLPRADIIPIDEDTDKPKNSSLQPLSELEIKSDFVLQKSLQRTTIRTEAYTERPTTTLISRSSSTTVSPIVFTLPILFPTLPERTISQLRLQPVPSLVNGTLGAGFPSPFVAAQLNLQPQQASQVDRHSGETTRAQLSTDSPTSATLEQLGCGFDLLSQTCKDVFGLGWCSQCIDLGNVFLHDCKCSAPTQLGRTANALFTNAPTTPLPGLR